MSQPTEHRLRDKNPYTHGYKKSLNRFAQFFWSWSSYSANWQINKQCFCKWTMIVLVSLKDVQTDNSICFLHMRYGPFGASTLYSYII